MPIPTRRADGEYDKSEIARMMDNRIWPPHKVLANMLINEGCEIITSVGGWPDLFVKNQNGELFCVEVKKDDRLSSQQERVVNELHRILPVYVCRMPFGTRQPRECSYDELFRRIRS